MKAWVIKTKTGYVGYAGNRHKLNEAHLYSTKRKANKEYWNKVGDIGMDGDEVIQVEIEPVPIKEKTGHENIVKALLKKLTSKELAELCDAYDDGCIETIFMETLLPKDAKNRPEQYSEPNEDNNI